jgi:hypothetical protein
MSLLRKAGLALLTAVTSCGTAPATRARAQNVRAPDFTLIDTDGKAVALKDLLRRGPVILAFFPKAFTAG